MLPPWPTTPPASGPVVLRQFADDDVHLAVEMGEDPHIPLIGGLPAHSTAEQAVGWIHRHRGRHAEGAAPANRGRGIATSALTALTTFAWTIPALHRIELDIEPWNTSSIRVAQACGYQREGLLRSHQEIGGTRRDMLLYAATRP